MGMQKGHLLETARAARQLVAMIEGVVEEIDNQATSEYVTAAQRYETVDKWPDGPAPDAATHPGYSKSTAALKRRSMDLTRLLADLRRPA